jgi:hypothetical protein
MLDRTLGPVQGSHNTQNWTDSPVLGSVKVLFVSNPSEPVRTRPNLTAERPFSALTIFMCGSKSDWNPGVTATNFDANLCALAATTPARIKPSFSGF